MMARFCARIRKRDNVPTVSIKDVYAGLTIAGLVSLVAPAQSASEARPTGSRADIERIYAEVLAEILGADSVATDKHFFEDLGADSLDDGPVLRSHSQARRRSDGVDKGRLRRPHDRRARQPRRTCSIGVGGPADGLQSRYRTHSMPRCWSRSWARTASQPTSTSSISWARIRWS